MTRALLPTAAGVDPQESAQSRVAPLKALPAGSLLVHEIYTSVQGESTFQGRPCGFIRLTGCHLRCRWCDTAHAFHHGSVMTTTEVLQAVEQHALPLWELTGGEPLLQPQVHPLMTSLCERGITVLLETSGGVSTAEVDPRVHVILDVKTPSSGESARNVWSNLERLRAHDEVKFVIAGEEDYRFAREVLERHRLWERCAAVLFSPAAPAMAPVLLAEWVMRDRLPVRFQLQLHKVLWGERRGV